MTDATVNIPETLPSGGRRFRHLAWFCALTPFLLLVVFITLGVHVRLGLGHWPRPVLEEYHTPAFHIHEHILGASMLLAVFGAGPLWLLCLLVRPLRPASSREILSQLLLSCLGWLLIFAVLNCDPTSFSAWWLD